MTSIQSSIVSFDYNWLSNADQSMFNQLDSSQNQSAPNDVFGGAFSFNFSDAALNALGNNSAAPIVPTSVDGPSFAMATAADGGPLPAFLAYVDTAMHLSTTQQQSLQNIAAENMDVNYTPSAVQKIAMELQQAGIPENI